MGFRRCIARWQFVQVTAKSSIMGFNSGPSVNGKVCFEARQTLLAQF